MRSISLSIVAGRRYRSTNHAAEHDAIRSSSETEYESRPPTRRSARSWVSRVRPVERRRRPLEPPAPSRSRARGRLPRARRGRRASASARRRSRSVGAASSSRVSADSGRRTLAADVVGSNSSRTASQNGLGSRGVPSSPDGLTDEHEPASRPRAGGREQVAVAARGVGPHQPRAARARRARVGCRRRGTARRAAAAAATPCSSPRTKTVSKRRCAGAHQVEHGDPSGRRGARRGRSRARAPRARRRGRSRCPTPLDRLELVERSPTASCACRSARAARPSGGARVPCALRSIACRAARGPPVERRLVSQRHRAAAAAGLAKLHGDLDCPVAAADASPAQPAFDPVDVLALQPRVRGAQVRVELGALAVEPAVPQEREQRVPERRCPERRRPSNATGCRARRTPLEREPRPLDGRTDDRDLLRRSPPRIRARISSATSSRVPRVPAPSRNRIDAVEWAARRIVGEQLPLEMRDRGRQELARPRRELDDVAAGERREVVDGSPQGRVGGSPRLVRQGDVNLGARGERLEQPPFRLVRSSNP